MKPTNQRADIYRIGTLTILPDRIIVRDWKVGPHYPTVGSYRSGGGIYYTHIFGWPILELLSLVYSNRDS
jgi:hypothetical protein